MSMLRNFSSQDPLEPSPDCEDTKTAGRNVIAPEDFEPKEFLCTYLDKYFVKF